MLLRAVYRLWMNLCFRIFPSKKHTALNKFKSGNFYEPGLEQYLKNFEKQGTKHDFNFIDFALCYSYGLCHSKFSGIYRDALYTLILAHNEAGVACIGFDVDDRSTITIKQIQGVSGKLSILQHFRWEKMLLNIVMDWAKNAGFKKVRVIKAESNKWYTEYRAKDLFMKYDVTARRSGFKFDKKDQTYIFALT